MVPDAAGGAIVAWMDSRGGSDHDIYVHRVLPSGIADPAWPADGRALCTASGFQYEPQLVEDGSGSAVVTWYDGRSDAGSYTNPDVFAQHALASGVVDPAWPAGGRVLSTAPSRQLGPIPVTDGVGGAIVAWDDARNDDGSNTNADIYAQRVLANGELGGGAPRCLEFAFELMPRVLNSRSNGRWVTGFLHPPAPLLASQIDVASIRLNGTVSASMARIEERDRTRMLKFSRDELESALDSGDRVAVEVTGTIAGSCFDGQDFLRVIDPRIHTPRAGIHVIAGSATEVRWDPDPAFGSVVLASSGDDGATWQLAVPSLPNTGRYSWIVHGAPGPVRLAIMTVDGIDETGLVPGAELAVSDPFTVSSVTGMVAGGLELAVRPLRNPLQGAVELSVTIPGHEPARLAIYDVGGRTMASREVGSLGPGRHVVRFGSLPVGAYVARLSLPGRSVSARVIVLD